MAEGTEVVLTKLQVLRGAQLADPGPRFGTFRYFSFTLVALCACLCSGDNGLDSTIMSSVNSMTQFQHYFGLKSASPKTGIIFGMYTIGQVVAFFPSSYLPDRFGRRFAMFAGNLTLIVGALVSANARSQRMLIAGRFITGLGCSTAAASAKSFLSELASPTSRGRWMGFFNCFYYVGQILASGIAVPLGTVHGQYSWRTPLYVQALPASICLTFVFFCPESPRWLRARGRQGEAARVLARLHSRDNDVNSPLVQLQMTEMEEAIDPDGPSSRFWDFRAIFATGPDRYRFGLAVIVAIWGQLAGNGLVTYFLPVLLGQAGIKSPHRQRILNLANSITAFCGALIGTSIIDGVGRRALMLYATCACTVAMSIIAGLLSDVTESKQRATAGVVFIFFFQAFAYSPGWTPLHGVYTAEVLAYGNRAKGIALASLVTHAVNCINTFAMPVALQHIGWRVYTIFAAFDLLGACVVWRFIVETRKLTLEELDYIFASADPKKTSLQISASRRREGSSTFEAVEAEKAASVETE